jgi:hypothetical protein
VSSTPTFYQWLIRYPTGCDRFGPKSTHDITLKEFVDGDPARTCTCPLPEVHRVRTAIGLDEWFQSTKAPIRTSFAQIRRRFAGNEQLLNDLGVAWGEFARQHPGRARQSLKRVLADPTKPTLAALPTAFPWKVRIPAYRVGEITAALPGAFAITTEAGRPDVRWLWLSTEAYNVFMDQFANRETGQVSVAS